MQPGKRYFIIIGDDGYVSTAGYNSQAQAIGLAKEYSEDTDRQYTVACVHAHITPPNDDAKVKYLY